MANTTTEPSDGNRLRRAVATHWILLLLAGILVLGAWLRLLNLDKKSLWYDEAFSLAIVDQPSLGAVVRTCRDAVHPPVYHLLLYGANRGIPTIVGLRVFSVVLGLGAILLSFGLGRVLRDPVSGLYMAGGVAVSPLAVHYSQELRMYALLSVLTVAQLWVAVGWSRRRSPLLAVALALLSAAAVFTQYYALFPTISIYAWLLIVSWRRDRKRGFLSLALPAGLFVIFLLPWLGTMIEHGRINALAGEQAKDVILNARYIWSTVQEYVLGMVPVGFVGGLTHYAYQVVVVEVLVGVLLFLGLLARGVWVISKQWGSQALGDPTVHERADIPSFVACTLGLTGVLTLIHVALLDGRFYSRYAIGLLPVFFFVIGEGARSIRIRWLRVALVAALLSSLIPSSFVLRRVDVRDVTGYAYEWFSDSARPNDVVIHTSPWSYLPFRFYVDKTIQQYLWDTSKITSIDREVIDPDRIVSEIPDAPARRIWVLVSEWSMDEDSPVREEVIDDLKQQGWIRLNWTSMRRGLKWMQVYLFENPRKTVPSRDP